LLGQSDEPRYVDDDEVLDALQNALRNGDSNAVVRIRYLPTTYSVESGVYGFGISRRTGLPFGQIDNVNPGVDWNVLSIGQEINLPSRDIVMPLPPVEHKRIVVDLDRLYLVGFENGEVAFHWPVSSGRSDAPTYPGIYQILSKDGTAYGSGFSLCGEGGACAQWEMDYFMSIYEVGPGLMNGFHGAVRLPNGAFLDGGSQQVRSTFGCVMSDNSQAEQLYEWAEEGIVVEIVSQEFPPESDLGRAAIQFIDSLQQA
ncbi:MAG: L,D-transpeptidase, partial [Anaerolineae bacterium]|nr:L,D-transpeptidase [Anaerolineae bacterium]